MGFFEEFLNKELNFCDEINNLEYLLKKHENFSGCCVSDFMSQHFLDWNLRGTSVSFTRFKEDSGINKILDSANNRNQINLEDFLKYLEYVINITDYCLSNVKTGYSIDPIFSNLRRILEIINFEFRATKFQGKKIIICVEKDFKIQESVENINDEELAGKILLYRHHSLKGNLFEKAIILSRLNMYFEGIRDNLSSNNFNSMCDLIGTLSNKLKIRHKPNKKEELIIEGFSNEKMEEIYDNLYEAYLTAIIIDNYYKNKNKLEIIKKKFDSIK